MARLTGPEANPPTPRPFLTDDERQPTSYDPYAARHRPLHLLTRVGVEQTVSTPIEAEPATPASLLTPKELLLATVLHDLQQPLTVIHGQAHLLKRRLARHEPVEPERLATSLAAMDVAVVAMLGMIGELLDAARAESGFDLHLQRGPTDLVALARSTAAHYGVTTDEHQFLVDADRESLVGWFDSARVQRVLSNLLSNAVKFSPGGGAIRVRVALVREPDGDYAELAVQDRGLGIPAPDQPFIFDQFHRGSNVAQRVPGSGLGLAGVRRTVEEHGGTISVTSEEGAGSTFTVRLPLAPAAEAASSIGS